MSVRRLLSVVAVLALVFAACGGDDGGLVDSANESSNGDVDLDDVDLGDIDLDDVDLGDGFVDAFVPEGCEFFFDFTVAVGLAIGGNVDFSRFDASQVPADLQDDVALVLNAFEGAGDDPAGFTQIVSDPQVADALDNIDEFSTENCDPDAGG